MKKLAAGLLIFLTMSINGCVAPEVKGAIERNAARVDRFVKLIENDETTREQEQNFIRAFRPAYHSLNYYFNDVPLPLDLVVEDDQ